MFRELLGLFGPQDRYEELHGSFMETFRTAAEVFEIAHEAVWSGDTTDATGKKLRGRDTTVNAKERELRKALVRHLSVQQGLDILFCLRLMSLVKDVERIGDYGKNLFEVGELRQGEFDACPLRDDLQSLGGEVNSYLAKSIEIFEASDEDGDKPLRFSLLEGPPGMKVDPATGVLRWRPEAGQMGKHPVEVAVHDPSGDGNAIRFEITVGRDAAPASPSAR